MALRRDFIAYHDTDRWGSYESSPLGKSDCHWTRKNYREETLVGHRMWVIEGHNAPAGKLYELRNVGIISHVSSAGSPFPPGRLVHFRVEAKIHKNNLTTVAWFRRLLKSTGRFRFGLTPLSDPKTIEALELASRK
jgi:hypothetical protein